MYSVSIAFPLHGVQWKCSFFPHCLGVPLYSHWQLRGSCLLQFSPWHREKCADACPCLMICDIPVSASSKKRKKEKQRKKENVIGKHYPAPICPLTEVAPYSGTATLQLHRAGVRKPCILPLLLPTSPGRSQKTPVSYPSFCQVLSLSCTPHPPPYSGSHPLSEVRPEAFDVTDCYYLTWRLESSLHNKQMICAFDLL